MNETENLSLIKRFHNNPNAQRLLLILAIIYVLSPVDIVPDTFPVIGWLDDAGIILAEIAQYLLYAKNKKDAFEKTVQANSLNADKENK